MQPNGLAAGLLQEACRGNFESARRHTLAKSMQMESLRRMGADARGGALVEQYALQSLVRPLFGKGEPRRPLIGARPDFKHLAGTRDVECAPITTRFMDLEGSRRLGLFYSLEEVYLIKNAIISGRYRDDQRV
jgi:hypothetical protein